MAASVSDLKATLSLTSTDTHVEKYFVYWMDDTRDEYSAATGYSDLSSFTASHTYDAAGQYDALIVAQSSLDDSYHVAGTITLTVAAPTTVSATGPAAPVAEGQPYTLTLDAPEGITMWTVDWGDGTDPQHIAGPDATPTHHYQTAPTSPIYATATDDVNVYDADPVFPDLLPNAPDELDGEAVSGQEVNLSWTDNSGIEDGFLIEQAEGTGDFAPVAFAPASTTTAPATVSFTLPGPFHPSTAYHYHFRVSALSGSTLSDPTNTLSPTALSVPEYPTDLTATVDPEQDPQTQITLAWTDNAADDEDYTVQRSDDGGDTWTPISLGDHESGYVDTDVNPSTHYIYRVFASNDDGPSGYASAERSTFPEAPTGLAATATSFRRIDLNWDDASGNAVVAYEVHRDTTSAFTSDILIDTTAESSYADTTVQPGTTYYYRVIALTDDGVASDASSPATLDHATTPAAPAASGDTSVDESDSDTYTLTLDANGNLGGSWLIDWGDGSDVTSVAGTASYAHHPYAYVYPGQPSQHSIQRTISVQYVDADGTFDLSPITVSVHNVAPVPAISGPTSISEGESYALTLSATGPGQNPIVQWYIVWGDGTTQTIYGNPSVVNHLYSVHSASALTISATPTDSCGDAPATAASTTVFVGNVAPVLSVTGDAVFLTNNAYTLNLSATDPGNDDLTWNIDWDDGSDTEYVNAVFSGGVALAQVTHTFLGSDSSHDVTVTTTPTTTTQPDPITVTHAQDYYSAGIGVGNGTLGYLDGDLHIKDDYSSDGYWSNCFVAETDPPSALQAFVTGEVNTDSHPLYVRQTYDFPTDTHFSVDFESNIGDPGDYAQAYIYLDDTLTLDPTKSGEEGYDTAPSTLQIHETWLVYVGLANIYAQFNTSAIGEGSETPAVATFHMVDAMWHEELPISDDSPPVVFKLNGSAIPGTTNAAGVDYTATTTEGATLVSTGQHKYKVEVREPLSQFLVQPNDDSIIEWTEDATLHRIGDEQHRASLDIVDNDSVDVVIESLPEETDPSPNEIDPGALLGINNDDDVTPGVADSDQFRIIPATDDDLVPVQLHFQRDYKAGATVTLSTSNPWDFRVWKEDGTQLLGIVGHATTPIYSTPVEITQDGTMTAFIEATDAGSTTLTLAAVEAPATTHPSNSTDALVATAGNLLDVDTVTHNQQLGTLAAKKKMVSGAFIPENNDDDDYSIGRTLYGENPKEQGEYGEDKQQVLGVTGEDDLLRIVIHSSAFEDLAVTWPDQLRLYTNNNCTGRVNSGYVVLSKSGDTVLFVEGYTPTEPGTFAEIKVLGARGRFLDGVRVTVFEWLGPLNVPQYGKYEYKITKNAPKNGAWIAPVDGTMTVRQTSGTKPQLTPNDVDIKWGAGPVVDKAVYQANDNYIWDLGVNVVKVTVENPDANLKDKNGNPWPKDGQGNLLGPFIPGDVHEKGPNDRSQYEIVGHPHRATNKYIFSGSLKVKPGMTWGAKVTFTGPDGGRGVAQMCAGFLQNLTMKTMKAKYQGVAEEISSNLEGKTFFDCLPGQTTLFYSNDFFQGATPTNNSGLITSSDTPDDGPRTNYGGHQLEHITLIWDFDLYVVAVTTDKRNQAKDQRGRPILYYAAQAKAHWKFNGSGKTESSAPYAWTADPAAGNTPAASWTATTGEQPACLDGDHPANNYLWDDDW